MRHNLKKARTEAGLTQEEVAAKLGITSRYYRMIERGERNGDFEMWDAMEDLFGIHQRILRELSADKAIE